MNESFTTGQIARLAAVNINVVKRWITDGLLVAYRLPAGHYRVTREAYLRFLGENRMPVPLELAQHLARRVLVIDDDPVQRNLLEDFLLVRGGYEVQTAGDGYEGLIRIGAFQPQLVFLDIAMPKMDGFALLDTLAKRAEHHGLKIVVVTGNRSGEAGQKFLQYDIFDLLLKPFTLKEVALLLQKLETEH